DEHVVVRPARRGDDIQHDESLLGVHVVLVSFKSKQEQGHDSLQGWSASAVSFMWLRDLGF
ncbi:UDP-glucosyl transferase, partial [Sesbania bispinosa]